MAFDDCDILSRVLNSRRSILIQARAMVVSGSSWLKRPYPGDTRVQSDLDGERRSLPIYGVRQELMRYLKKNECSVIVGETGSGKSTQVPQVRVVRDE
jgi:HrpA-like RNA helicase